MECTRTRGKQYRLTLKRDVIVDNYDAVVSSPCYVEKGTIKEGPLLLNNESIEFNQIKTSETLLKDESGCAWIVGYAAKNKNITDTPVDIKADVPGSIEIGTTLENWEYYQYKDTPFKVEPYSYNFYYNFSLNQWIFSAWSTVSINSSGGATFMDIRLSNNPSLTTEGKNKDQARDAIKSAFNQIGLGNFRTALFNLLGAQSTAKYSAFNYYNGKTIKTSNGKFYKVIITQIDDDVKGQGTNVPSSSTLHTYFRRSVQETSAFSSKSINGESFMYDSRCRQYKVTFEEQPALNTTIKVPTTRNKCIDAVYDMFCLPYGDINIDNSNRSDIPTTLDSSIQLYIAQALAGNNGGGGSNAVIYDVQLLPYCPMQNICKGGKIIIPPTGTNTGLGYDYSLVRKGNTESGEVVGVIFYPKTSSFTFNINQGLTIPTYQTYTLEPVPEEDSGQYIGETYLVAHLDRLLPPADPEFDYPYWDSWTMSGRVNDIRIYELDKNSNTIINSYRASRIQLNPNYVETRINNQYFRRYPADGDISIVMAADNSTGAGWDWFENFWLVFEKFILTDSPYTNEQLIKLSNCCDTYRLVSPNYQGQFEFSLAKNGDITYFNVDCNYKPFSPYIHVNPDFNNLYGRDFNDARGLICSGDFSIGMYGDQFEQYQLQNKNYEAIFNRQIQNMDVKNSIANQQAKWGIAAGTVGGGISGAVAGGMSGGGIYGAIAGAAVGTGASLAGGIMDYKNMQKLQAEEKDYAKDMYNFNLQNIQALPYSITKTGSLTINNKFFPLIEYYTCTPDEKNVFIDKLKYNGMTIMKISTLDSFIEAGNPSFIKGQLIRLENMSEDTHMARTIYEEILKGVYI